jgi:hypothetical protein
MTFKIEGGSVDRPALLNAAVSAVSWTTVRKASGIVALTEELVRLTRPGSDAAMRCSLTGGIRQFVDATFLSSDAATAAVPAGRHPQWRRR